MIYIYYNKDSGNITGISPAIDAGSADPYLSVDDDIGLEFLTGKVFPHQYTVTPQGELRSLHQTTVHQNWTEVNDKIYQIPMGSNAADFNIKQFTKTKTIEISATAPAPAGVSQCFLVACLPTDPHLILWHLIIPADQLTQTITHQYTGADNIRFYTKRIFNTYNHEQHN